MVGEKLAKPVYNLLEVLLVETILVAMFDQIERRYLLVRNVGKLPCCWVSKILGQGNHKTYKNASASRMMMQSDR